MVQTLAGNLGYVDVDRLEASDVEGAFQTLQGNRGIIFDMRGYLRSGGVATAIAKWVNRKGNPVVGQTYQPQLLGGWHIRVHMIHRFDEYSDLRRERATTYRGAVAVLIDERAQSAGETFAQMLKPVADAKLFGGPTTGANGPTTGITLPGGITIRYTANDARKPDGTQFQRIGHQPDIKVLPTIAGIRAGRDEVLERAVAYLRDGR